MRSSPYENLDSRMGTSFGGFLLGLGILLIVLGLVWYGSILMMIGLVIIVVPLLRGRSVHHCGECGGELPSDVQVCPYCDRDIKG